MAVRLLTFLALALVLAAAICWPALEGRQATPAGQADLVFRSETNLALIRFYVEAKKHYVWELRADDFQLLEDGVPQKIAVFEYPGERRLPVEMVLLFDASLSVMDNRLLDPFSLKTTILDGLGNQVGISIYAFNNRRQRFARYTRDMDVLQTALKNVYDFTHSGTRLYESIRDTARDVSGQQPGSTAPIAATRVMVIFSDGFDTTQTPSKEAVEAANECGIPLYPVVLGHQQIVEKAMQGGRRQPSSRGRRKNSGRWAVGSGQARAYNKEKRQKEFADIGAATGGRSFDPPYANSKMIREVLQALVNQIQSEYVAGYYPESTGQKKKRKVEVKLVAKDKGKIHGGARTVVH